MAMTTVRPSVILICALIATLVSTAPLKSSAMTINQREYFLMGDQMLESDLVLKSMERETEKKIDSAPMAGRPLKVETWQDGVIPISFGRDVEPPLQALVIKACQEWAHAAPALSCRLGSYKNQTLKVTRSFLGNSSGCWSMLGQGAYFMGLRRHMNLGYGCDRYAVVLHEMGHVLGFTHEHQRADRDQYIEIHSENVSDPYVGFGMKLNFDRQKTDLVTGYDFLSIMHYHRDAFSKNGRDTIVPKPPYASMITRIGNSTELSPLDISAIRKLYPIRSH
jgi:hypothetical protein